MHPLIALLLAASVKDGGADLRAGCEPDADLVAQLPPGTDVAIRFSLSGSAGPCYKVIATSANGKTSEGYLPKTAIADTSEFDKARKSGGRIGASQVMDAVRSEPSESATQVSDNVPPQIKEAIRLMDSGQAERALQIMEKELKVRRDPELLALAGAAAWRADDADRALGYWKQSLDLYPNPRIEALYKQVLQETKGDQSNQRMVGIKVMLRYEGLSISAETAREMVKVVDQEYARISSQLGCTTDERVVAIAQSLDAYRKTTGAAEWSGGQFDGRIRVPVFERGLDAQTRQTLAHEMVHACLAMIGDWPSWLHEGMAQKFSGDSLSTEERARLDQLAKAKRLPTLAKLGNGWGRLGAEQARTAYALALRAVEVFEQEMSAIGFRNLMRSPERLPQITAELDKKLGLN